MFLVVGIQIRLIRSNSSSLKQTCFVQTFLVAIETSRADHFGTRGSRHFLGDPRRLIGLVSRVFCSDCAARDRGNPGLFGQQMNRSRVRSVLVSGVFVVVSLTNTLRS